MEKAVSRGTLKDGTEGILREHKEFRKAWEKAGRPKNFVWDGKNGETISPELSKLYRPRRELQDKIARRRAARR
jgi:hypothetical protein